MSADKTAEKTDRLAWLDCLKIFAAFLIVMQHSMSYEWIRAVSEHTDISYILNLFFMISRSGVPVFFMCSGVGMLQKDRTIKDIYFKSIFRLLRMYVCWMLLYGIHEIYRLFITDTLTVRTGINALIKSVIFGQYHTWFIAALLALYIIIPFLQKITSDIVLTKYYILLSIVFTIILPYIGKMESLSRLYTVITDADMHFVVGYSLYFVLGYYLTKTDLDQKKKMGIIAVLIASILVGSFYSFRVSVSAGTECQTVYGEFSVVGFLLSVSVFLSFRCFFDVASKSLMKNMAALGIGIYLLHPLFLPLIGKFTGLWCLAGGILIYFLTLFVVGIVSLLPIRYYFLGMTGNAK